MRSQDFEYSLQEVALQVSDSKAAVADAHVLLPDTMHVSKLRKLQPMQPKQSFGEQSVLQVTSSGPAAMISAAPSMYAAMPRALLELPQNVGALSPGSMCCNILLARSVLPAASG